MATIEPVEEGLERYFAPRHAVDHRAGDPGAVVRVWFITERTVEEVPPPWGPEFLDRLWNQRYP